MTEPKKKNHILLHAIPITLIVIGIILFYYFGLHHYFSFHYLKQKYHILKQFVHAYPYLSPILFTVLFIFATTISLPVFEILGILSGFLFPMPWSVLYILIGATIGSSFLFLSARTVFRDFLRRHAAPFLEKVIKGFQKDAWSYLLFIRLIPIFPFWFVNLVSAFTSVRYLTFLWTTLIGSIPLSYVHAQVGKGLDKLFETGEKFSFENLLNPQIRIALILMAFFALLPVLIKKFVKRRK